MQIKEGKRVWARAFASFVLHPNSFCYESLPEAEQMTLNGTISETWRAKGIILIKSVAC